MIYIDRKPPTITRDGIELDGVAQDGVPYYGEPVRGGVRIYLDDKLATIVKRQELDPKQAKQTPDGELHWSFADFLKSKGVDRSQHRRGLGDPRQSSRGEDPVGQALEDDVQRGLAGPGRHPAR